MCMSSVRACLCVCVYVYLHVCGPMYVGICHHSSPLFSLLHMKVVNPVSQGWRSLGCVVGKFILAQTLDYYKYHHPQRMFSDFHIYKEELGGWSCGYCFCRGLGFCSLHPQNGSQLLIIPVSGDLKHSCDLKRMWCMQTHTDAHTHSLTHKHRNSHRGTHTHMHMPRHTYTLT